MEQLRCILVVAGRCSSDASLLDKALRLARGCGAKIHLPKSGAAVVPLANGPESQRAQWQKWGGTTAAPVRDLLSAG